MEQLAHRRKDSNKHGSVDFPLDSLASTGSRSSLHSLHSASLNSSRTPLRTPALHPNQCPSAPPPVLPVLPVLPFLALRSLPSPSLLLPSQSNATCRTA